MLKEKPEDFIVEEIPLEFSNEGNYFIYKLEKKNLTLQSCIRHISKITKIPENKIGYAGIKDKKAVTTQYVSLPKKISNVREENFNLTFIARNNERLTLGNLKGNKFTIFLRNYHDKIRKVSLIPNYFDEQRFSKNNFEVGLNILRKEWNEACKLVSQYEVVEYLNVKPNDYVGSLKQLPKRILKLYIHTVQSRIFNELLSKYIKNNYKYYEIPYSQGKLAFTIEEIKKNFNIPLPGFEGDYDKQVLEKLKQYGLTPRSFIIHSLPELSSEGDERKAFVKVKNINSEEKKEGTLLSFELEKGAYATIVVKALTS